MDNQMNTPYNEGQRAAKNGRPVDDNPYTDEQRASRWEEGYYSYEPKQKIRRGKPEWN
jgi:hypothetical protein